jgi:alkylation response protein AidB-like acyl-CoA dehydrogenase
MRLTAEQLELVEAVRGYVREHVVPARERLDSMRSLDEFPWDVVAPGTALGLKTLPLRPEFGGRGVYSAWPAEKLARDALTLTHGNGTNALMVLKVGTREAERRLRERRESS